MAFKKTENINQEIFGNSKSLMITLWEISQIANSDEVIRFHGGVNNMHYSLFFDSKEYFYIPYEGSDFSTRSDGGLQRPKIKIINFSGFLSRYLIGKDDMLKAKVVRKRTFLRFLDKENFLDYDNERQYWAKEGVNPDPSSTLRPDVWYINQKTEENKYFVEFELSNALDLEGATLPRRQIINNYCTWKYRGKNCGYNGNPCADYNNVKFDKTSLNPRGLWQEGQSYAQQDVVYLVTEEGNDTRNVVYICTEAHTATPQTKPSVNTSKWVTDACSKTLTGCKLRFPVSWKEGIPFGGFPSSRIF
tara:strand:- start:338 stop:1249 length:912 start_codon:yes stop_codon:yes gene_type:complete